jgi:predicted lysophospholipase L1 biosynthesis ABC-type transport system permease subunit
MRQIRSWFMRLAGLFGGDRRDRELADELESHLRLHVNDNIERGMTPEAARRHALIKLGGVESLKESYRDRRGLPLLETLAQDLRYGLRTLLKAPALVLATVGIYGVMHYSVVQRTQEIGVRVVLGAGRPDIMRLVIGEGARLALAGIAVGVGAALMLTRLINSLLFGVSPSDPITLSGVALLLGLIAMLACYIPARRATRVYPNVALHYE